MYTYTCAAWPTHMRQRFSPEELRCAELAPPFTFTKGVPTLRIPGSGAQRSRALDTMLFDLASDPQQQRPCRDEARERPLLAQIGALLRANDAPAEQYARLGLAGALAG